MLHHVPGLKQDEGRSHIIRNNEISWCEQAGIVGSMGGAFSKVTDNHIHRIHDAHMGIWLDWMTQGTRVTQNLCYRNFTQDLFLEVNHGPFVIDNNIFLSRLVKHHSQGGAYVHNLFGGVFGAVTDRRHTPYFEEHSTIKVADHELNVGDDRFYNNMFTGHNGKHEDAGWMKGMAKNPHWRFGYGLWIHEGRPMPPITGGNIYYDGANPYKDEKAVVTAVKPDYKLIEEGDRVYLEMTIDPVQLKEETQLVTSELLGKAKVPNLGFKTRDGRRLVIDTDYFGKPRDPGSPTPGPFENPGSGRVKLKVWPLE